MIKRPFHHALAVSKKACRGCTRCMKNCPTEAIRIIRGTAQVDPERCIDCGQCLDACPYRAITIEQDDFSKIFDYSHRVAIFPAVFIGQFPDEVEESWIFQSLLDIGFTHLYESEFGVDVLKSISNRFSTYASQRPVISSYCPAVVRLIQIRYPNLVDHINLLRPPMEITALYVRQLFEEAGISKQDVGVFFVTPCAAKIADIKTPHKGKEHLFNGVINLDYLYNLVYSNISRQKKRLQRMKPDIMPVSTEACLWSLTQGESRTVPGRSLAIDEIHNVIEFLEMYENNGVGNLDFLELRACSEGCAGGVLNPGNTFLTSERLLHRSEHMESIPEEKWSIIQKQSRKFDRKIKIDYYEPHSTEALDEDISEALKKMNEVNKLLPKLPGIDCGLCGAPSCEALAKDIVQNKAAISHCGVLQLNKKHSQLKEIWGDSLLPKP